MAPGTVAPPSTVASALARRQKGDVLARLALAESAARAGRLDEALEHYLWCADVGLPQSWSWIGVMGSSWTPGIVRLAARHPAARSALDDRVALMEKRIHSGVAHFGEPILLFSIRLEQRDLARARALVELLESRGKTVDGLRAQLVDEQHDEDSAIETLWEVVVRGETILRALEACRELARHPGGRSELEHRELDACSKSGDRLLEGALRFGDTELSTRAARVKIQTTPTARRALWMIELAERAGTDRDAEEIQRVLTQELPDDEIRILEKLRRPP